jgi:hypothetical protein
MTILTPPAVFNLPSRLTFAPVANTQSGGRSPFDGTEQTLRQPGERWGATLGWDGLTQAEWRPLMAFLAQLGGRAGRFTWSPPFPRRASGLGASGPIVAGAGQTGASLALSGWQASAQAFLAGDLLSWTDAAGRRRLHMATADVTASGGGTCTVAIAPPLRSPPVNASAVEILAPSGVFRLSQDRNPMDLVRGLIAGGSIDIEEALV